MSAERSAAPDQGVRDARARGWMAILLLVGMLAIAAILVPFTEDSVFGRTAAVLGATSIVLAGAALCLYAINRRLAGRGSASEMAGAADLVALTSLSLPLVGLLVIAALARPFELIQVPAVALSALLFAQLVLVAVATRHAVRRG